MANKKSLIPIIDLKRDLYRDETLDSGEITTGTYHIPVVKYNEGKKEIVNVNLSDVYEKASFDELQQQIDELDSDKMDKFNLSDYLTSDALDDYVTSGDFNSAISDLQEQIDDLNSDIELLSDALDDYVTKETPISIKYSEFEDGSDMQNSDFIGRGYVGIQKHVEESDLSNPQSYNWIKDDSIYFKNYISDSGGGVFSLLKNTMVCLKTTNEITINLSNNTEESKYDFSSDKNFDFKQIIKIEKPIDKNITLEFTKNNSSEKMLFNLTRKIGDDNSTSQLLVINQAHTSVLTILGMSTSGTNEYLILTITKIAPYILLCDINSTAVYPYTHGS